MTEPILLNNLVSRLPLGICVVDKNFKVLLKEGAQDAQNDLACAAVSGSVGRRWTA